MLLSARSLPARDPPPFSCTPKEATTGDVHLPGGERHRLNRRSRSLPKRSHTEPLNSRPSFVCSPSAIFCVPQKLDFRPICIVNKSFRTKMVTIDEHHRAQLSVLQTTLNNEKRCRRRRAGVARMTRHATEKARKKINQ